MRAFSLRFTTVVSRLLALALVTLVFAGAAFAQSQASSADLNGTVTDPSGAVVPGATVTARDTATGITRNTTSDESGEYKFIGLPPSTYEITAEATTFKKTIIPSVRLTVGQNAELTIRLEVGAEGATVTVTGGDVELVETTRTTVSSTIDQQRIENLPINERSATGFALTISTVGRDNGRPIGPAPTSGLNIGGQRGRSTLVQVDGSDFTDNSINAARTTVSQEAVQEFQVATNSYAPEFGRATGGIINVVTKRGTNEFTGNVFGFIRDKSIQARNPFAPFKTAFTRTQYGATLGGPLLKDRSFFFFSFERRQRNESGFFTSDVTRDLTSSVTFGGQTFNRLTAEQAQKAQQLIATGNPSAIQAAVGYLYLASGGGTTALTGVNPLVAPPCPTPPATPTNLCNPNPGTPFLIGSRFFLTGAPIPLNSVNNFGEPIAFRPLLGLQPVFPITDRTNYFSLRGDHYINQNHQLTMRFGYNPSNLSGIQVESQNQSLGQNDFSRTGITKIKDTAFTFGLNSTLGANTANEFRFHFGKRKTSFRSQNNEAVAFNISGTAFIGRELFSPVDRTENRFQLADNLTQVYGDHTFKFGADFNWVEIPSALFELNFAGLFNFGPFAAANLNPSFAPLNLPDLTPVQSYGLGLPSLYIQGFGNPISKIKNKPIAFYAQDTWKATRRLTLNYGIRYDVEFTETIAPVAFRDPLTGINLSESDILAAQDALGVQQGIPRDTNNWAPRLGVAYDVFGNGRTVLRGAIGLFYDHPLLAVAFNSDIADAAQQQQAVLTAGSPNPAALLNAAQVFQGTVCGGAAANPLCAPGVITPGLASTAQYQFGRQRFNDQTFTGFGPVLPFTLPIAKDFKYASAVQANLAIEHQLTTNMSLSVGYIFVGARNLPHPTDLNTPNTALQIQNFQRFFGGALPTTTQQAIAFSIATTPAGTPTGVGCTVLVPGIIAQCPNGRVVAPAVANFFRPNAPNYFLAQSLSSGALTKPVLDSLLAGSLRTPGTLSPFGSVNAQISNGNSEYNALNVELKRRFANNLTFQASYTWAHSIDDSSDLQTLLIAQDVRRFDLEKADSLFDQRHRFVFSGVLASPAGWRGGNGWQRFLADFTIAPIIEISSGRPFNIITNVDTNNDQSTQTDRPSVNPDGTLCQPGTLGCITPLITNGEFSIGNLGRNMGLTHGYASFDLRVARAIRFGERIRLDLIAEGFNLFNRFNEASASPFLNDVNAVGERSKNGRYFSRSTAAYDPRQFQFGVKLNF
ncbi:MAG TPA: TonB-dependent receptor [Pyrinomonadaceae bacterium]|jgi:hypothetical protein